MINIEDGGPIHPCKTEIANDSGEWERTEHHAGMSLRDWFAGQALAGMSATLSAEAIDDIATGLRPATVGAVAAYSIADAMIAARKTGGQ